MSVSNSEKTTAFIQRNKEKGLVQGSRRTLWEIYSPKILCMQLQTLVITYYPLCFKTNPSLLKSIEKKERKKTCSLINPEKLRSLEYKEKDAAFLYIETRRQTRVHSSQCIPKEICSIVSSVMC